LSKVKIGGGFDSLPLHSLQKTLIMKKATISLTMICLLMTKIALTQIVPDAGPDRVVCTGFFGMDTIDIGGSPSATGGTPPYTYAWEAEYTMIIGNHTFYFSASDFLNDTTLANPEIIHAIGDTIRFKLTITDAQGLTAIDSTSICFAYFGTHLGNIQYTINQGDSVFLSGWENVSGGFPPYEYLWQPNHGLADSTSLNFWAKPQYSVAYYMTLTDSAGCVVTGAPVYFVNVQPVLVDEHENQNSLVKVYPNPVKSILNIQINPKMQGDFTLRLFLSNGKLIEEKKFPGNEYKMDLSNYADGIYIYEILDNKGFSEQGRVVVK
jgi:hypothetical protein